MAIKMKINKINLMINNFMIYLKLGIIKGFCVELFNEYYLRNNLYE